MRITAVQVDTAQAQSAPFRVYVPLMTRWLGPACASLLFALTIWIKAGPAGRVDGDLLELLRRLHFEALDRLIDGGLALTSIPATLALSAIGAVLFLSRRRWLEATALVTLLLGFGASWALALLIGRAGPSGQDGSFPSTEVAYATIVYAFFLLVMAGERPAWRLPLVALCCVLMAMAGVSRFWTQEHWLGDIVAGYALAGLFLALLVPAYLGVKADLAALPLVHAAPVPHDETEAHAHALTSTVIFQRDTVYKIYNPGFVPRLLYWAAFQSRFAYAHNPVALQAAVERRNLAALLTEYWYGSARVGRALGVYTVDGRLALASHFVQGTPPEDPKEARRFLGDLSRRFDAAGLPTWQIDPRQPRSLGNALQLESGEFTIIDLESGLVSPLASPRAWWRAIRRGRVPIYDDVYFDVTRSYVDRERASMLQRMGAGWLGALDAQLDAAEALSQAWHRGEPRVWSRALRYTYAGFGIRESGTRIHALQERGLLLASEWTETSIDRWLAEGRYSPEQADRARERLRDSAVRDLLPHLGVHLVIGVLLRFPFGSIARVVYTTGNLFAGIGAFFVGRSNRQQLRRTVSIHSPLVILVAALPGIGTFSYLVSGPGLANTELLRLAVDGVGRRLPWRLYARLGVQRCVARPIRGTVGVPGP
ncbi:MAG: phosphatase PAP2 family protein [Dehalococcoidia bacterium]